MNTHSNPGACTGVALVAPLVELIGVTKRFGAGDATVHALRDVNLAVAPAAFTALTGPSGSGKSTLLNILGLLDEPTTGVIAFDGRPVDARNEKVRLKLRREHFGFVFQSYNLVPALSALENVELALFHAGLTARQRRERAAGALDMVGLEDRLGHRPREMSGGQQQRVAVARALVRQPRLVLADEPTANLDAANAMKLLELMGELRERTATAFVVSTHDHRMIPHFPDVVELEDGRTLS